MVLFLIHRNTGRLTEYVGFFMQPFLMALFCHYSIMCNEHETIKFMNQNINKAKVDGIDLPIDKMSKQVINLIEQLSSNETTIRLDARNQLIRMGSDVLPYMHKLLKSKDKQLRWEAAKTIEAIGHPDSIPDLLELLEKKETDFRWIASEALINIGRQSIVPLLQAIIARDETHFLRSAAQHVFNELFTSNELDRYSKLMETLNNKKQLGSMSSIEAKKVLTNFRQQPNK